MTFYVFDSLYGYFFFKGKIPSYDMNSCGRAEFTRGLYLATGKFQRRSEH